MLLFFEKVNTVFSIAKIGEYILVPHIFHAKFVPQMSQNGLKWMIHFFGGITYLTKIMADKVTVFVYDCNVYSGIMQSHLRIFVQLYISFEKELCLVHVFAAVQHCYSEVHQHALYAVELVYIFDIIDCLNIADVDHVVCLR